MSTSFTPKWKRKGYGSEGEYRGRLSARGKTREAALAATKVRCTHIAILRFMWDYGDRDLSEVTVTKQQIMAGVGCNLATVRRALKALRDEGSIAPKRNWQGGAGVPTTWQLIVPGQNKTPLDQYAAKVKEDNQRAAAWDYLRAKFGPMRAMEIMDERGEDTSYPQARDRSARD